MPLGNSEDVTSIAECVNGLFDWAHAASAKDASKPASDELAQWELARDDLPKKLHCLKLMGEDRGIDMSGLDDVGVRWVALWKDHPSPMDAVTHFPEYFEQNQLVRIFASTIGRLQSKVQLESGTSRVEPNQPPEPPPADPQGEPSADAQVRLLARHVNCAFVSLATISQRVRSIEPDLYPEHLGTLPAFAMVELASNKQLAMTAWDALKQDLVLVREVADSALAFIREHRMKPQGWDAEANAAVISAERLVAQAIDKPWGFVTAERWAESAMKMQTLRDELLALPRIISIKTSTDQNVPPATRSGDRLSPRPAVGKEKWRTVQSIMLNRLAQGSLPTGLRAAWRDLKADGWRYNTVRDAARKSDALKAHFKLKDDADDADPSVAPPDSGEEALSLLAKQADLQVKAFVKGLTPKQKEELEEDLEGRTPADQLRIVRLLTKDPTAGWVADNSLIDEADQDDRATQGDDD